MAKRVDPLKAKQRKQKIIAAVLGVVFLGVGAFQGPKLWKQLHPKNAGPRPSYDAQPASATTGATPSLAAPTLGGSAAPSATPASPSLASATPTVEDGQLNSFSLFASKDPFAQQLSDEQPAASSSSSSSGGSTSTRLSSGKPATRAGGSASAPTPGTAVISVNGTLYTAAVGTDFPQASSTDPSIVPLFHVVSLTAHSAKISIVGGSYSSGAPAVTLTENKPVTLMNTADRTRYKLILKPAGTAVPTAPSQTSTTSKTVTVPPPSSP
ncbi:MAG: hypothetical protein ACJ74L_01015 [Gaiellaceae bacterium]